LPLSLDCSVGGHVLTNESYYDAFIRETKEELNLDVSNIPHKKLGKLNPNNDATSAFMEVYAIFYDGPVHFNPDDFTEGAWMSPEELKLKLQKGTAAKNDLKHIVKAFL